MGIEITDKAVHEFKKLGVGGSQFIRINVIPGGCSGMTYSASIENTLSNQDEIVFEDNDIRVVADLGNALFLDGLKIDFSNDLVQAGFRLTNQRAAKSCGCGSSFSV